MSCEGQTSKECAHMMVVKESKVSLESQKHISRSRQPSADFQIDTRANQQIDQIDIASPSSHCFNLRTRLIHRLLRYIPNGTSSCFDRLLSNCNFRIALGLAGLCLPSEPQSPDLGLCSPPERHFDSFLIDTVVATSDHLPCRQSL